MSIGKVVMVLFGLILLAVFLGSVIYGQVLSYRYERALGSYMETATDTITPESFKEQLVLFKEAIPKAGLAEEDYGALWFKKPDNSMKFQMQHIDSIIGRADAMILWQQTAYNQSGQSTFTNPEAFRDVYNDKMNNLRTYIHAEGYRSDWIAKNAWYVKYHPVWLVWSWVYWLFLIAAFIALTSPFWWGE